MAFLRRIWNRDESPAPAACTALDIGTEFAKALVFEIDDQGTAPCAASGASGRASRTCSRARWPTSPPSSTTARVALQEAEEMAGFRPTQVVIGIAGELVKGFTTTLTQERRKPDVPDQRRRSW